ncbi:MAG: restriction endonuclease subunit S [Thermoanaerobaculia bacterium]|nr:restriction endonuclease subunit S [Thermoanaerobaculia bacterium]MBP7814131.1 restriction endonuclease subunit S [Thermoanaerobaculia bacterium]HPA95273.1 restriction endonuclease subunit S [Thermoanaerobaculia bacterium]
MIADLRPYPAMKDSGVAWLGEVPEHWEIAPAFAVYRPRQVKNTGLIESTVLSLSYGRIIVKTLEKLRGLVPESFETYQIVESGNIIVRTTDLQNDQTSLRVGHAQHRGIITAAYMCLETKPIVLNEFGYQYLNAYDLLKIIYGFGSGLRQNLDFSDIKRMPVLVPPRDEQAAIVRFLDYADRRIRRYIRAKQKLIKLLEEQKQAIIHRAVTRGLDPNVRFKPSGVEWLGDVPEHWEVLPLKRIAWFKSGSGFPVNEQGNQGCELPFLRVSDMTREGNEIWIETPDSTISRETAARLGAFVFPAGSIIFPKVGGALLTNKRRILRVESCIDNNVMGCVVSDANRDYVFLLLEQIDLGRLAKPGPVPAISEGEVRAIRVALPPIGEQALILNSVRAKTASLNAAILSTQREVSLLREYRTRLIADVVTGKLDVREAAARLPQEAEDTEPLDEIEDDVQDSEAGDGDDVPEEAEA